MISSIADNVRKCMESFKNVASNVLGSPNAGGDIEDKLTRITEEWARFKVWSGNIGAHRKGRSSLEYRLRDASNLQKHVNDLLDDLNESLVDGNIFSILMDRFALYYNYLTPNSSCHPDWEYRALG
jgi:hypothetical protein